MNENILIVAHESIQTRSLLQGLRGIGIPAHLLPGARSSIAFSKIAARPSSSSIRRFRICPVLICAGLSKAKSVRSPFLFCFCWMTRTINSRP